MATVQNKLSGELNELLNTLSKDINFVSRSLCLDTRKSYMTTAMKNAYKEAGELTNRHRELAGTMSKTPLHQVRVDILRTRLLGHGAQNKPSVFADVGAMTARDLEGR